MSSLLDIGRALGACELFSELSPEHRQTIAGICRATSVGKGDTLFMEGRPGTAMYILAAGSIQLVKAAPDGREVVIRTVMPGGVFGEVVLFESDTYPVTAVARRNSTLYQVRRSDFQALLSREEFRNSFMAHLARRLRYLAGRILHLTTDDVEERFFRFLREQYGQKNEYIVHISKKDLAAAIGTTPETLSRLAARLRKEHKISWHGKTVRITPKRGKAKAVPTG